MVMLPFAEDHRMSIMNPAIYIHIFGIFIFPFNEKIRIVPYDPLLKNSFIEKTNFSGHISNSTWTGTNTTGLNINYHSLSFFFSQIILGSIRYIPAISFYFLYEIT